MKKLVFIMLICSVVIIFIACGKSKDDESKNKKRTDGQAVEKYTVAYVTDYESIDDKFYAGGVWNGVSKFAKENVFIKKKYNARTDNDDTSKMKAIEKAINEGADIIVFPDSTFANVVYEAQSKYKDVEMLLVDFEPTDEYGKVSYEKNTTCISFKEEEMGYMAGYVAVAEGYRKLGFYGAKKDKASNAYGYGFIQGAGDAAQKLRLPSYSIKLEFRYVGGYSEADAIVADAKKCYENGTEVIYCCSGNAINSIIKGTDKIARRKVIGSVTDNSNISNHVIFSSMLDVEKVIKDKLRDYVLDDNQWGMASAGNKIDYGINFDAVSLSATEESWRLRKVSIKNYQVLYNNLKNTEKKIYGDYLPTTSYVVINMKEVNRKVY